MGISEPPKQKDYVEGITEEKKSPDRTTYQNCDATTQSKQLLVDQHAKFSCSSQSPQVENGEPDKKKTEAVLEAVKQPNRRGNSRKTAENKSTRRSRSQKSTSISNKQVSVGKEATLSSSSPTKPLCPMNGNDAANGQLAEKEGLTAMKQQKRKTTSRGHTAEKRLIKKISSQQCSATSQSTQSSVEKDVSLSRSNSTLLVIPQESPSPTTKINSAKIKLQLFPLDDFTRTGLEQDGHNPHLELTLNPRKKICSVIKHLNNKWGSSSIGFGEPMLFPYSALLDNTLGEKVWTLKDDAVSAGEVHATLGSPPIFRLRYGWIFNQQQFASTSHRADDSLNEDLETSYCRDLENQYSSENKISSGSTGFHLNKVAAGTDIEVVPFQTKVLDAPVTSMDDNLRRDTLPHPDVDNVSHQTPIQWHYNLTNISIGGLFSEASLQGLLKSLNTKQDGSKQQKELTSDSLDAFASDQFKCPQGPKVNLHDLTPTSIFDAEETCQPFSFQKLKSSGNGAVTFERTANSQVDSRAGAGEENVCHAAKTDHLLCSQVYNDERSLGLRGIKWTESLGPFDLQLPSSRKISNGDSISLSSIIS